MGRATCKFTRVHVNTDVEYFQANLNEGQVLLSKKYGGQDIKYGVIDNMDERMWITGVDVPREGHIRDEKELLNSEVIDNTNPDNPQSSHDGESDPWKCQ